MRNWLLNRRIPNGMYGGVRGRETNLVSHLLDRVPASGVYRGILFCLLVLKC